MHKWPRDPVNVNELIAPFLAGFADLPEEFAALTVGWMGGPKDTTHFVRIVLRDDLQEPSASAMKRHAEAHELGHVIAKNIGQFVMLSGIETCAGWEHWEHNYAEAFCELVAAYLLISEQSLLEMRDEENWYIARVLDVPEHLVELRWSVWSDQNKSESEKRKKRFLFGA